MMHTYYGLGPFWIQWKFAIPFAGHTRFNNLLLREDCNHKITCNLKEINHFSGANLQLLFTYEF